MNASARWHAGVAQALVKKFTKQTVKDLQGPVTVVMGKKRRVTFIECPNDLNSMIVRVQLLGVSGTTPVVPGVRVC